MDNSLYPYRPITEREPLRWPGGARVAFYVGLNIEHFRVDQPGTSVYEGTNGLTPDPLNYGWRDYGNRVGFWRLLDGFDRYGIRVSAIINSEAAERYPQLVAAGRKRNWAWIAHGRSNSVLHTELDEATERDELADIFATMERATGVRPRGWLGPGLTETPRTPQLLAEQGATYVLDWTSDDQPFELAVPGMINVPYTVDLGDLQVFGVRGASGADYRQQVIDQFDQLYADSADSGRVMALALHPFVIGQPFRYRYLLEALDHIANHRGVWVTTSDDIAEHYLKRSRT